MITRGILEGEPWKYNGPTCLYATIRPIKPQNNGIVGVIPGIRSNSEGFADGISDGFDNMKMKFIVNSSNTIALTNRQVHNPNSPKTLQAFRGFEIKSNTF